ncbi:osmoprotectant transport system permease protein [Aureimonas altamirensis DSM 21988]|uniref:ABC transporter permease n=3 Tax=Aureimonas altamirensis TaxID=370622 RepID=A0A0N7KX16_9HYPH|nr:ABC transporter permease [Aureimonas altamirensis]SHI43633.1 osmoprotectant transport system permease protein [Aureimonas altamirensis DSM 21988]
MRRLDKLGLVIAAMASAALLTLPFATFRANRIVAGEGRTLLDALPPAPATVTMAILVGVGALALLRTGPVPKLAGSLIALLALILAIGMVPGHLTPPENTFARVSPASGFWVLLFAYALLATDALARLKPPPLVRVLILVGALGVLALVLWSGRWDGLSLMREYGSRADSFWREVGRHLVLALGSLVASVVVGIPLGIVCHRIGAIRAPILNGLNIVQTIPSIALFGLLIAPLGWLAANVPLAHAIGIRGIGVAPAFVALFLYSLLPVVANTVVGLASIPADADDAARGVGMTDRQRLFGVELPLAFPVILTGIRIVLVQNIGLATIAALIGGGGLGVFVFQGIGQTAMDLVLLGALPTVVMAFSSAIILDAAVEASSHRRSGTRA